jgi:hypothetical protein
MNGLGLDIEPIFRDDEVVVSTFDLILLLLADRSGLELIDGSCLLLLLHDG